MNISLSEQADLSVLYAQSHRKYHNIQHIMDCLSRLEEFCVALKEPMIKHSRDSIELALWYHDAVYNPYSSHNEERSCDLFYSNHPNQFRASVPQMIQATKRHLKDQSYLDETTLIMLDIDLSGLGERLYIYAANALNIRDEYFRTDDITFMKERQKFLQSMLKRDPIYYTEYFRNKYEVTARENMRYESTLIDEGLSIGATSYFSKLTRAMEGRNMKDSW